MRDDLLEQLAQLNPVPDPDRLVVPGQAGDGGPVGDAGDLPLDPTLRDLLEQARTARGRPRRAVPPTSSEETEMSTLTPSREQQPPPEDRTAQRRWLVAVGAAAAVLVAVAITAGVLVLGSDEPAPPTVTDTDGEAAPAEVQLAQAYIEARNAYDAERVRELVVGESFRTTEPPDGFRDLDTIELAFDTHRAFGFQYVEGRCDEPVDLGAGRSRVRCEYGWMTELQRITGDPAAPAEFVFFVEDGLIDRVSHGSWHRFDREVYSPWLAYVDGHHPELASLISPMHRLDPDRTPRALELLPEAFEGYATWLETQED
jgi:hypothetical protein